MVDRNVNSKVIYVYIYHLTNLFELIIKLLLCNYTIRFVINYLYKHLNTVIFKVQKNLIFISVIRNKY